MKVNAPFTILMNILFIHSFIHQSTNEWMNEWTNQSTNPLMSEWMNKWMSESINPPMNEWITAWSHPEPAVLRACVRRGVRAVSRGGGGRLPAHREAHQVSQEEKVGWDTARDTLRFFLSTSFCLFFLSFFLIVYCWSKEVWRRVK